MESFHSVMEFRKALSRTGLYWILGLLLVQMSFLAMTLNYGDEGLAWMSRKDKCGQDGEVGQIIEFYHSLVCVKRDGEDRTCGFYNGFTEVIEEAEDDFKDAGGLAAAALTFTVVQIILVIASLHAGDNSLPFFKSDHLLWKLVMLFLDVLVFLFVLSAAAIAGESDVLDANIGCDDNEITTGYGTGMCAFLVVYVLAKTIFFLFPFPSCLASPAAKPGASESSGFTAAETEERKDPSTPSNSK